jgi:hypothetical protein
MRYFGMFDQDGYPLGFYPDDVWPDPPDGAVEITEGQWLAMLNRPGTLGFKDGEMVELPMQDPVVIGERMQP